MRIAAFTASDNNYFPMLEGMLLSLPDIDITVFSENISLENLRKLPSGVQILNSEDFHINYKNFQKGSTSRCVFSSFIRTKLPDISKADIIIWIDADIWFQDSTAIKNLILATQLGDIAAIPEVDRIASYMLSFAGDSVGLDLLRYYGPEAERKYSRIPILNDGLFAAKRDSRVWKVWQEEIEVALRAANGRFNFGLEQAALSYALLKNDLPISPLPYTHNYSAHIPLSMISGELRVNAVPFEKIHTIHQMGESKKVKKPVILRTPDGKFIDVVHSMMDFKSIQKLKEELNGRRS